MHDWVLLLAILAAPASLLMGVAAGACIAYRLTRGQPPVPRLWPARIKAETPKAASPPKFPQPATRA